MIPPERRCPDCTYDERGAVAQLCPVALELRPASESYGVLINPGVNPEIQDGPRTRGLWSLFYRHIGVRD